MKLIKQEINAFTKGAISSLENVVPRRTDILVIGGGIVGSAVAFFLKNKMQHGLDVTVVERDHCVSVGQFANWVILHAFLLSADFFQNKLIRKILSRIPLECQTVWIQIRPDTLSGLIWFQTVCKGYQQMTPVGKKLTLFGSKEFSIMIHSMKSG